MDLSLELFYITGYRLSNFDILLGSTTLTMPNTMRTCRVVSTTVEQLDLVQQR